MAPVRRQRARTVSVEPATLDVRGRDRDNIAAWAVCPGLWHLIKSVVLAAGHAASAARYQDAPPRPPLLIDVVDLEGDEFGRQRAGQFRTRPGTEQN